MRFDGGTRPAAPAGPACGWCLACALPTVTDPRTARRRCAARHQGWVFGARARTYLLLHHRPLEEHQRMSRITDPDFRLRDHHTPPTLPASPKTGLNLATLHRPALKLADYIHSEPRESARGGVASAPRLPVGNARQRPDRRLRDRDDAPLDRGLPSGRRHPGAGVHDRRRDQHLLGDHRLRAGRPEHRPRDGRERGHALLGAPGPEDVRRRQAHDRRDGGGRSEQPQRVPDRDRRVRRSADRHRAADQRTGADGVDGRRRREDREQRSRAHGADTASPTGSTTRRPSRA